MEYGSKPSLIRDRSATCLALSGAPRERETEALRFMAFFWRVLGLSLVEVVGWFVPPLLLLLWRWFPRAVKPEFNGDVDAAGGGVEVIGNISPSFFSVLRFLISLCSCRQEETRDFFVL